MRRQPCYMTHQGCADRRRHWADPEQLPRGIQYIDVPDDRDELLPAFCSLTCAALSGWMPVHTRNPKCPREDCGIHHGTNWVCMAGKSL
jgi:hypothetical protein